MPDREGKQVQPRAFRLLAAGAIALLAGCSPYSVAVVAAVAASASQGGGGGGGPAPARVEFSGPAFSVPENAGSVVIDIVRTGRIDVAIDVDVSTSDGTATALQDYTPNSVTVSWAAGDGAPKTFTVDILDDGLLEGDETVILSLSNPVGARLGGQATATLTILDNDAPGNLEFSAAAYQVAETLPSVTITVNRAGGIGGLVGVDYVASGGTATPGADYTPVAGTLTWPGGDATPQTFTIPISDDLVPEGDETVDLTLSNPTGGASLGTPSAAVLTILDDEAGGSLQFGAAGYTVGAYGVSITIDVTRSGSVAGAVSVDYDTSDGTATLADADYVQASGTLNWVDMDGAPKTFDVLITDDVLAEPAETINLTLSNPTGGAILGAPSASVITIEEGWIKDQVNSPVLVVSPGGGPWDNGNVGEPTVLLFGPGDYRMWYWGVRANGNNGRIGYATSADGITWAKDGSNPVLQNGGVWDNDHVTAPSVLYDTSGCGTCPEFKIYYTGDLGGTLQIGLATSADGINWTKDPANPVLPLGAPGAWDEVSVWSPSVIYDPGSTTYLMFYAGEDLAGTVQIGRATSADGLVWTRDTVNSPVLRPGPGPSFDDGGVAQPSVVHDGVWLRTLYTGFSGGVGQIGYARSVDLGVTWEKYRDGTGTPVPVLPTGGAGDWDEGSLYSATWDAFPPAELWYDGEDGSGPPGLISIGRATHP